ncbi:helix-turn-helix domain-containing protein, partial [Metabacillus sp. YM-086]|uniref:helix-turn-helix domain-containing protein n=1 Tax=Metabacillus sp. YM-086 TaxID=3341729 RepID=UPI003A86D1B2
EQFKFMVVREYQEGQLGFKLLAKKYGIKSHKQIINWVNNYEKFGPEGLMRKKQKKIYSVQFKLDVLSFMKSTGSSVVETALEFGLTNPPMISAWKKAFLEGGADFLDKQKGRPPMSDKAINRGSKKVVEDKAMTYEQKLERENELLRLEVEYLKKLQAFQVNPEGYLEKHRQHYRSNSKKSSN